MSDRRKEKKLRLEQFGINSLETKRLARALRKTPQQVAQEQACSRQADLAIRTNIIAICRRRQPELEALLKASPIGSDLEDKYIDALDENERLLKRLLKDLRPEQDNAVEDNE